MKKNRIVLDTNVLLVSLSSHSRYHWIFRDLTAGRYELCVSNDILTEYEEVIALRFSTEVARNLMRVLMLLPNVRKTEIYYFWDLLEDRDDNKFVDTAVSCGACCIVTEDRGYGRLASVDFPRLPVYGIDTFRSIMKESE